MGEVRKKLYTEEYDPYSQIDGVMPFNDYGWASQSPWFKHVIDIFKPKLIVELGTWFGGSARHMAELALHHHEDLEIVCIDTFLGSVEHWTRASYTMTFNYGRPNIYEQFMSNNVHKKLQNTITPFPIDSHNGLAALQHFEVTPDLIYVDAAHDYHTVKRDLLLSKEIVKVGGVIMGDDFRFDPVAGAARDVFGPVNAAAEKFWWVKE